MQIARALRLFYSIPTGRRNERSSRVVSQLEDETGVGEDDGLKAWKGVRGKTIRTRKNEVENKRQDETGGGKQSKRTRGSEIGLEPNETS